MKRADELADMLERNPRSEVDLDAAKMLRRLGNVYEVAREVVMARSHEHSKAAYAELVDIFKGRNV